MASVTSDCPRCGLKGSLTFSEWTENGAPHGAGYWPMQMSDVEQTCECELTDEELEATSDKAWQSAYEDMAREEAAYAAEIAGLKDLAGAEELDW